jgi:hypothetical protein
MGENADAARAVGWQNADCLLLCRFSDAGDAAAGHKLWGRRRKSAKARNRGGTIWLVMAEREGFELPVPTAIATLSLS